MKKRHAQNAVTSGANDLCSEQTDSIWMCPGIIGYQAPALFKNPPVQAVQLKRDWELAMARFVILTSRLHIQYRSWAMS